LKNKKARSAALLVLVLALACAGATPASTVKGFYTDIGEGNVDDALGLVSAQILAMFGKNKLRLGLQEETKKMISKGGLREVQITDVKVVGDTATVASVLRFGNGTEERTTDKLVREAQRWRLTANK
jgi:hypothetical protein